VATRKRTRAKGLDALTQCIVRAAGYPGYGTPTADLGGERFRRWLAENAMRHMLEFFAQALDGLAPPGALAGQTIKARLGQLRARGMSCSFHDEILSLVAARQRVGRNRPASFVFRWARPAFFIREGGGWIAIDPASRRGRANQKSLFVEWRRVATPVGAGQALTLAGEHLRAIGLMLCAALDELRNGVPVAVLAEMRRVSRRGSGLRAEIRAQTAP